MSVQRRSSRGVHASCSEKFATLHPAVTKFNRRAREISTGLQKVSLLIARGKIRRARGKQHDSAANRRAARAGTPIFPLWKSCELCVERALSIRVIFSCSFGRVWAESPL
jgi:hypothetical protein